jgi:hypothetical protein
MVHPVQSLDIRIPAGYLIRGAIDEQGNAVALLANGNNLAIHLGEIQERYNRRLPL